MQPSYPVETERLLLRPFVPEDFDALYAYQSRDDVTRWLYWGARSADEVRKALDFKMQALAIELEGDAIVVAAVVKATNRMIGDLDLCLTSRAHQQGEIGYVFHPDFQGQGYATEAARALLRVAFEDLKMHRVVGCIEARNTASGNVLKRLGMREEAHLIENEYVRGEWQSEIVFAMLDREWRELNEPRVS